MPDKAPVVLLHGLWMRGYIMYWMARRIAQAGYTVYRYSYPSVRVGIAENARRLAAYCHGLGAPQLHLVGHSLGGLLIAHMLDQKHQLDIGRVVLVGAPFNDSFAARRVCSINVGRALIGTSVTDWMDGVRPQNLSRYEVGVIAGAHGVGFGMMVAPGLPKPNDGTVSVAETIVPGARDHIVLKVSHTQMVISSAVARQVGAFLLDGHFAHPAQSAE